MGGCWSRVYRTRNRPDWRRAQATDRNAQYVLLSDLGHVDDIMASQPGAFERLLMSYFANGEADASGCVEAPLSLRPLIGLSTIARLLVAAGGLAIGALAAWLIRIGLRVWRGRPHSSGHRPA